jgi:hypothetical protein
MSHFSENNDHRTEYIEEREGKILKIITLVHGCLKGINLVCQLKESHRLRMPETVQKEKVARCCLQNGDVHNVYSSEELSDLFM